MTLETSPRVMMITGSSGAIGSQLVSHFVSRGWMVLAVDKQAPSIPPPANAIAATCDLAKGSEATAVIEQLFQQYGAVDALINCAGQIANSPLITRVGANWHVHEFSLWDDVIASSLTSAFRATATCVRHMLQARKRGVVINISSVCASGNAGQVAYSAAKAGLNGLTFALAKELGPLGIRVVALAPGYFDTTSTRQNVSEETLTKVTRTVPLKRLGRVAEIADAIDFIIRNEYVNGTIVELDGGLVV